MVTVQQRNPRTTLLSDLKNREVYDFELNRIDGQNKIVGFELKKVGDTVEGQMYMDVNGERQYQISPKTPSLLMILEDVQNTIYRACSALSSISPQEVERANLNWEQLSKSNPNLFDVGYFMLTYHMLYISVRLDEMSLNTLHETIPWVSVLNLQIN